MLHPGVLQHVVTEKLLYVPEQTRWRSPMDLGKDDALAKAFASIAAVGERVGSGTLGAYELQVFIKRNFGHSADPVLLKEMMGTADESECENGAPSRPPPHMRYPCGRAAGP